VRKVTENNVKTQLKMLKNWNLRTIIVLAYWRVKKAARLNQHRLIIIFLNAIINVLLNGRSPYNVCCLILGVELLEYYINIYFYFSVINIYSLSSELVINEYICEKTKAF